MLSNYQVELLEKLCERFEPIARAIASAKPGLRSICDGMREWWMRSEKW